MADYWENGANANTDTAGATNGAQPAAGDAAMDDEILVCLCCYFPIQHLLTIL